MRLLLDTHAVIWFVEENPALSTSANAAIKNPVNSIYISVATLWELAIKVGLGKLKLPKPVEALATDLQDSGALFVPIVAEHAMATRALPWHHRDPFDRMIIVQAQLDGLTLVTCDSIFTKYSVPLLW